MNVPSVVDENPGTPGLVSVIIPTFNRGYIIHRAIGSVLEQTYGNVEVIVADDGSTDNTEELVRKYDARVRYVRQTNAGPSAARNFGMRHARGEFVAFLDSDDEWFPWKLALQVALLERIAEAGMVWTDMTAIDEHDNVTAARYLQRMYHAYSKVSLTNVMQRCGVIGDLDVPGTESMSAQELLVGDIFQHMLLGSLVHTSTVLLRRTRLLRTGGFDESLTFSGEDYEFHLRTCFEGPVAFASASSIRYRVGAGDQLTGDRYVIHIARNNLTTLTRWLARGSDRITSLNHRQISQSISDAHYWLGTEEFDAGNRDVARAHLTTSLKLRPRNARALSLLALTMCPAPVADGILAIYRRARGAIITRPS